MGLNLEMEPISSKSRTVKFFPQKKSSFKYSIDANGCCMEPREKKEPISSKTLAAFYISTEVFQKREDFNMF